MGHFSGLLSWDFSEESSEDDDDTEDAMEDDSHVDFGLAWSSDEEGDQ